MSNVVKMPMPSAYKGIKNAEDALNVIRRAMYPYDPHDLAKSVGVTVSCIWAIRSGRTKWPRASTFFALLEVLDLEMIIQGRGA